MPNRVDKMISEGMGTVKSIKAAAKGLVGVFRVLSDQHGQAAALLLRAKGDADKRAELWPEIRRTLLSHEKGELSAVYPELARFAETRPLAEHHDREAGELERTIHAIDAIDMSSDAWQSKLEELIELVQHHVDEEEGEIFPRAQEVLGEDKARALESSYIAAQDQVKR
ncbi:MAG TPA: hemerythrin domain-containing protein, partial [Minicystis sp.]|nr:hemerythrin domain-containing protein [Minicystis sp.]